jgi:O-antigen/teichoic acid export membrane protein
MIDLKYLRDLSWQFVSPIVRQLRGLLLIPLITKTMGITLYSDWVQFGIAADLMSRLFNFNLGHSIRRYVTKDMGMGEKSKYYSTAFNVTLIIITIIFAIIILNQKVVLSYFKLSNNENKFFYLMIIFGAFKVMVYLNSSFLSSQHEFKYLAIVGNLYNLLGTGAVFGVGYYTRDLYQLVLTLVVSEVLKFLTLMFKVIKTIEYSLIIEIQIFKRLTRLGFPLIFASYGLWIVNSSDRLFIVNMLGEESNAIYSVYYTLGLLISVFAMVIGAVLLPYISNYYDKNEHESVFRTIEASEIFLCVTAIPMAFGLVMYGNTLIGKFATEELVYDNSVFAISIMLGGVLYTFLIVLIDIFNLKINVFIINIIWVAAGLINIVMNIILIPKYGVLGASIATNISLLTSMIVTVVLLKVNYRIVLNYRYYFHSLLASILMFAILYGYETNEFSIILLQSVLGYLIFILTFYGLDYKKYNAILKNMRSII